MAFKNVKGKASQEKVYTAPSLVGDITPEIRGTATSALTSDELSHIRGRTPEISDSKPWGKRKGDPGKKESAQARN